MSNVTNSTTRARRFPSLVVGNKPVGEREHTHPGVALTIDDDGGLLLSRMTTAERDALVARYANDQKYGPLPSGTLIYNTDTKGIEVWNGNTNNWNSAGGGSGVDLNITVSDQTSNTAGSTPLAPPAVADIGDVHLEVYSDTMVWYGWDGSQWNILASAPASSIHLGNTDLTQSGGNRVYDINGQDLTFSNGVKFEVNVDTAKVIGTTAAELSSANATVKAGANVDFVLVPTAAMAINGNAGLDGQVITSKGAGVNPVWAYPSNTIKFADDASVSPASPNDPTIAEIQAWASSQAPAVIDAVVYYTGSNVSSDAPTRVYYIDRAGTAILIHKHIGTYVKTFVAGDWTSAGNTATLTIPASMHGVADPSMVQVWESVSGTYNLVGVEVSINQASKDVTLTTVSTFAGRVRISE